MIWTIFGFAVLLFGYPVMNFPFCYENKVRRLLTFVATLVVALLITFIPYLTRSYRVCWKIKGEYDNLSEQLVTTAATDGEVSSELYDKLIKHNMKALKGCGSKFWENWFTGFDYNANDYIISINGLRLSSTSRNDKKPATITIDGETVVRSYRAQ